LTLPLTSVAAPLRVSVFMNDLLRYVDDGASNDEAGGNIPRCSALVKTMGSHGQRSSRSGRPETHIAQRHNPSDRGCFRSIPAPESGTKLLSR
jgi:hypothetical protein